MKRIFTTNLITWNLFCGTVWRNNQPSNLKPREYFPKSKIQLAFRNVNYNWEYFDYQLHQLYNLFSYFSFPPSPPIYKILLCFFSSSLLHLIFSGLFPSSIIPVSLLIHKFIFISPSTSLAILFSPFHPSFDNHF